MTSAEWHKLTPQEKDIVARHRELPPTDLKALAAALELEVRGATLSPGVSGEISPKPDGNYLIRVDRHEPKSRQRFTVAHEIAHFLLHRDRIGDGITDDFLYRSTLTNQMEVEANRMAAEILMPSEQFNERWLALGAIASDENLESLADAFQVSVAAVKIRLGLK